MNATTVINRPTHTAAVAAFFAALALLGCQRAEEKVVTKAAEVALEQAAKSSGAKTATATVSESSFRMETTDTDGKKTSFETSDKPLTAADLGVEIYPGAVVVPGSSSKTTVNK